MARQPRDDAAGVAHHVMLRGIERRRIFADDRDREDFLRRLGALAPPLGFRCFAWTLMPNHVHLVLRSEATPVSRLMARLGTGYARRFNERHDRVGHLFQNRFRSRRVLDEADLLGLVLYVLRNPLEGGLVTDGRALEEFRWCGLAALLGNVRPRPFEAVAETLGLFADDPASARSRLRDRLGAPVAADPPRPSPRPAPRGPSPLERGFDALVERVCARHGVSPCELRSRGRTRRLAAARADLAAQAAGGLGLSGAEIGRRLGLTAAAVSRWLTRPRARTS